MRPNFDDEAIAALHAKAGAFVPRTELLSFEQTAEKLGCSHRTLRYWEQAEKMPPRLRRGRRFFYRAIDIEKMLEVIP